MTTVEDVIRTQLPTSMSEKRRDELTNQIAEALDDAEFLVWPGMTTVEVEGARVPVKTVEAYGLTITLDANGNAVQVTSPWGLAVIE